MLRAGLISLVVIAVTSAQPAATAPGTRLAAGPVTQVELLQRGMLTVSLRAGTARARLRARLVARGGRRIRLGGARVRVSGPLETDFPLSARARKAIKSCAARRVVVTAVVSRGSRRERRRITRPVENQPPRCGRFFGPQAVWNRRLASDAPLDPGSGAMMAKFVQEISDAYRAGRLPPNINTDRWSVPVYTVPKNAEMVSVKLDQPPAGKEALVKAFARVPMPAAARPAAGTDRQLVVWQPSRDRLWEFWRARLAPDGWHAVYGGRLDDVSQGPGHFAGARAGWGATASSLPLLGGLITIRELQRGVIPHALAMGIPHVRAGVYTPPAQRTDGRTKSHTAIPEGARLRLNPALDLDQLNMPPAVRAIARAAQDYGIYVRDVSGAVAFYGQDPTPTGADPYPLLFGGRPAYEILRSFPWAHLQVLRMDLRREGGGNCGLLGCG